MYSVASRIWVSRSADLVAPLDRFAVAGDEYLGAEIDDAVEGLHEREGAADLVAAERVEIRDVPEERARQIAREDRSLLRKPHNV